MSLIFLLNHRSLNFFYLNHYFKTFFLNLIKFIQLLLCVYKKDFEEEVR